MSTANCIAWGVFILLVLFAAALVFAPDVFVPKVCADAHEIPAEVEAWQHIRQAEELFSTVYGNMRVHVFVELER